MFVCLFVWLFVPSCRSVGASGPHLLLQLLVSDHPEVEAPHGAQRQRHPLPGVLPEAEGGRGALQAGLLSER